jgi:hypothetical protein
MRRMILFLLMFLAGVVTASPHRLQEPDAMLESFRPALYFEQDGQAGERLEYPTSYVWDDLDIENNFAGPVIPPSAICYGQVHEQRDASGKICWVIEYHFYYPRNWTTFHFGFTFRGYSHEHDWEWLYVVLGSSGGSLRPYCATFSAHADNNQSLFSDERRVRLFPGIVGGSVWRSDWSRHPDDAPRVSLDPAGRVEATVLASGNEFDGSPEQGRFGVPIGSYDLLDVQWAASSCWSAEEFCYGDPALPSGCLICDGYADCASPRLPPWLRFGLGDQAPLPLDFRLPDDWDENPSTEILSGRAWWNAGPVPCRGWLNFRFPHDRSPVRIILADPAGRKILESSTAGRGESASLDVRGLSSGIYLARIVYADRAEEVQRVVVLH